MPLSPLIRFGTSTWTYEGWPINELRNQLAHSLDPERRDLKTQNLRSLYFDICKADHLKLIVFTRTDGRQFAVTGSANYTTAGTQANDHSNCELSVLFELHSSNRESVHQLFNILWEQGSHDVNPDDFYTESPDDRQDESSLTLSTCASL
jgi:hypothetical protein